MLQGSEDYRAVERLNLDLPSAQPVLIALLLAGGQAMPRRQHGFPAVKPDGVAEQQPHYPPCEQHR